jgi:transposase
MRAIKSWTVSEEMWAKVEPLIPVRKREKRRKYRRKPGGGRKPLDARRVFEGIVYVLRTGCQWKALPEERFGSASSIHKYFQEWKRQGVFVRLWRKGLAEYDDMEGIAWAWQSIDGAMVKAPLAQEAVGPNPTDRGKKREQAQSARRRDWNPAVDSRQRRSGARRETAGTDIGSDRDGTAAGPTTPEGESLC